MGISNRAFTGKLGNLVSYNLKGIKVIRHIGKTSKAPTLAQLVIRQKMATVINFLRPCLAFINIGFEIEVLGSNKNQHNAAVSYNTKHATQGEYPNISLDYSKVLVSKGVLEPVLKPQAALTGTKLSITWEVDPDMNWGIINDRSILIIYCQELDCAIYELIGTRRSTGRNEIELPTNYLGKNLHIYIAFTASDRKSISNSVYIHIPG
ncbi:MAG: DUF6266 family protein [Candidatus Pedobacter colombiensis]|uniref:DUF6266 family protein n=1 Tax=Candidatus Pedobacter colombiensis TaxID=3121371 RepID=A0AAJ5WBA4_9SPHI|nr:DUF6266 family protein [Pedobacter sp.]WEK20501.1 MAG: DUF6266 family protein [Pedobacter sp.]